MSFVNSVNANGRKDGLYGKVIDQINNDGVCPFCPGHITKYHPNPIIKDGGFWLYTKNAYPYKGAVHHFLLIHKEHIEDFSQITPEAWLELREFMGAITTAHNIKGGALVCRFGETKYTGASVSHLHAQVIVGPGTEGSEPVLMRVG